MRVDFGRVIDLLNVGGPVVWLLAGMSFLLLTLGLYKLLQFVRYGLLSAQSRTQAHQLILANNTTEAPKGELAKQVVGARVLLQEQALDDNALNEELSRRANGTIHTLRSHLRSIELIASLSPLIGLFGTVLGMIQSFRAMEAAGRQVDPSVLSGGIWVALLTTAVGLMVAIPASVIHNWLERRIDLFSHDLQDLLGQLLTAHRRAQPLVKPVPIQASTASHQEARTC
jgi:biopolymer transport protein ExbB